MVQGLTLQENVTYTSVLLEMPYVTISDVFLNGVGSDDNMVFTTQDLDNFNHALGQGNFNPRSWGSTTQGPTLNKVGQLPCSKEKYVRTTFNVVVGEKFFK